MSSTDYRDLIQQSMDYIEDNLMTEITAAELARRAGFSLYHFCRLFQSATGMSVMHYILRRRLLHAVYAIHCGSIGIEAALTYGFDTYAGFYKAFRREFGITHSAFLKSSRVKRPYRLNLTEEEHIIVTHKKAAQILKAWNLEHESIHDIYHEGTGKQNENACCVGEEYVLKYTPNPGKMQTSIALTRALADMGLCAAEAVKTTEGTEFVRDGELYFYLTRRIPGKSLSAADLYNQPSIARRIGEVIGQLDHALAKLDTPVRDNNLWETVSNWALPVAAKALELPDAFTDNYLSCLGELYPTLPRQIIHRDPNPGNIIQYGEKFGIIDFELSERNVRIYDPCYAATAILSENFGRSNEQWLHIYRSIIAGYDSVIHLTAEERDAVPWIILSNQLICMAWFSQQEKYQDLFETNKSMTRWLIDHLDEMRL